LRRCIAAAALAAALMVTFAPAVVAEPPAPSSYLQALQDAYSIIRNASGSNAIPAVLAYRVLLNGTGTSQPEVLDDLRARPPLYDDARARLSAAISALGQPATTSDPELAQQRLRDVMSSSRYDALHRPPSLLDRLSQWVQDRIGELLRLLFGPRGGSQLPNWLLPVAGILVVAAVVFVVFRASRGRFRQSIAASPVGQRPPADWFAEADALAARGDRTGAIRALCAGVAATLEGERSWEGSPLTVREIFQRAPDFASLRPLLLPFEAAVYGGRGVDQATYERAARVAQRFRRPAQVAA
jgi:hypothetical protein